MQRLNSLQNPANMSGMFERFGSGSSPSPFYNISSQFAPRNYHDVLKWVRYILIQSPITTEVLRKYATYPITEFNIDTSNKTGKKNYEKLIKSLGLKSFLKDVGFDYYSLGNVFISIYFPIHRTVECPNCGNEYSVRRADFIEFKNFEFRGTCPGCHYTGKFTRHDHKSTDIESINLVKWDPENVSVDHNPITGESEYYYQIPNSVKRKIQAGDKLYINSVPWGFVDAVRDKQDFKFDSKNIFHMKTISMGSTLEGLGMPPLVSLYSLVFYQATLRRANEAIASEYLTPLRAVFPSAGNSGNDPISNMSMQGFSSRIESQLKKHKTDPNHIMISPIPIGYQNLGGEGRNLLVAQEIDQAEQTILLSLGVSKELLSGTTNWTSSTVGLRLLENSMQDYVAQMEELNEWIFELISSYLGIDYVDVTLTSFQLTDNDSARQILLALLQQGKASISTLYESLGMDYSEELDKIKDDIINETISQLETEEEAQKSKFFKQKSFNQKEETPSDGGYQETLQKAREMSYELLEQDESTRRRALAHLQSQDPVLYSVVSTILEKFRESDKNEQRAEQRAQAVVQEEADESNSGPKNSSPRLGE